MTNRRIELDTEQAQLIARALADPRRYEILQRLSARSDGLACGNMRGCVDISAATLSHHMKELEVAGLVQVKRQGKFAHYQLRRDVLKAFLRRLRQDLA